MAPGRKGPRLRADPLTQREAKAQDLSSEVSSKYFQPLFLRIYDIDEKIQTRWCHKDLGSNPNPLPISWGTLGEASNFSDHRIYKMGIVVSLVMGCGNVD